MTDNLYSWNVRCNDTLGNSGYAFNNFSDYVDTTDPVVSIDTIQTTQGSQTIYFNSTSEDLTPISCKYSITNSTGGIDGLNLNVSYSCNVQTPATVTSYGNYTLTIYTTDILSHESSDSLSFETSESSGTIIVGGGGGGSGEDVEKIPVIALAQIDGGEYDELERAIFYARINTYCSNKQSSESQTLTVEDFSGECSLKKSDVEIIQGNLAVEGVSISVDDLILFYGKYADKDLIQVYMTLETIREKDLFTSVLGITNPMIVNPPRLDKPFVIWSDGGNITIEYIFTVNKQVKECTILKGENLGFSCELVSNNSVKMILQINDTDFFDEIFQGEMSITSDAEPANLEIVRISLIPRVYNLQYEFAGVPAVVLLGVVIFIVLALAVFFVVRSKMRKGIKRRGS